MLGLFNSVFSWLLAGVGAIALALAAVVWFQGGMIKDLREDLRNTKAELATCGGRILNIQEDARTDNEIDNLPDDALRAVPDHWLQPDAEAGD